jgi:hypothetical protein
VPLFVAPGSSLYLQDWLAALIAALLGAVAFMLCAWGCIEMAFLRDGPGTNRFGPNALGKQRSRRRRVRGRGLRILGWDQHSEIDATPHIGSPSPGMHAKRG